MPGFRVLEVIEAAGEVLVRVETTATATGCGSCGTRAVAHERRETHVRDLPCFGRPSRLVWAKRRWRCPDRDCSTKTWTESSPHLDAQVVLTRRAGAEACRRVGEHAEPVACSSTPAASPGPSGPRHPGSEPASRRRLPTHSRRATKR